LESGAASGGGKSSSSATESEPASSDAELRALRAKRLAQLKKQAKKTSEARKAGHGELREIKEEEFLNEVTSSKRVVVHFYHGDFKRCEVMDKVRFYCGVPKYFICGCIRRMSHGPL